MIEHVLSLSRLISIHTTYLPRSSHPPHVKQNGAKYKKMAITDQQLKELQLYECSILLPAYFFWDSTFLMFLA
jgi:hypothetical protein